MRVIKKLSIMGVLSFALLMPVNAFANDDRIDYNSKEIKKELEEDLKQIEKFKNKTVDPKEREKNLAKLKSQNPEKYEEITKASISTAGEMGTNGDILISYDSAHLGWNHGHSAIVRANNDYIVEAWTGSVDKVRSYQNNWANRWNSKKKMYIYGASSDNYTDAQNYAYSKIGVQYSILAGKFSTSAYYCSQLVFQAWWPEGFDLDGNGGSIVTPADLEGDSDTIVY